MSITTIMLHWKRHDNVLKIIRELHSWPEVHEIIIMNNTGTCCGFATASGKAMEITASRDTGLLSRFYASSFATCETLMYHDDDLIVQRPCFEAMYAMLGRCERMVGTQGRWNRKPYPNEGLGDVDVVLTRFCMFPRHAVPYLISNAWRFFRDPANVFNGEDVFLSRALARALPAQPWVPDMERSQRYTNLPEGSVGLARRAAREGRNYQQERWRILQECEAFQWQ